MKTYALGLVISLLWLAALPLEMRAWHAGKWYWEEVEGGRATITRCDPVLAEGHVEVPEFVYEVLCDPDGTPIDTLRTLTVRYIGNGAFKDCNKMTSLTLPPYLLEVGYEVFTGCTSLKRLEIRGNDPEEREIIFNDNCSFEDCPLEEISLHRNFNALRTLSLKKLWIYDNVKMVGLDLLDLYDYHNPNILPLLQEVHVNPETWVNLDYYFRTAHNGPYSSLPPYFDDWKWEMIDLYGNPVTVLDYSKSKRHNIGRENSHCETLEEVNISNGISKLELGAFENCENLKKVQLPGGLDCIEDRCFRGCRSLKDVNIPSGVTSIGHEAFYGCASLDKVNIPNRVTTIGYRAFYRCAALNKVYIQDLYTWMNIDFKDPYSNPMFDKAHYSKCDGLKLNNGLYIDGELLTELTIPKDITVINGHTFAGNLGLKSVCFHDSVTIIENSAFNCSGISGKLELPKNLTSIGDNAFYYTEISGELELPEKLTSIGDCAFSRCTGISGNLELPENLTSLGTQAFSYCKSIEEISLPKSLKIISGGNVFMECDNLKSFPDFSHIEEIGVSCFLDTSPEKLVIPANVMTIWEQAFGYCKNLKEVTIEDSEDSLNGHRFGAHNITSVFYKTPVEKIYYGRNIGEDKIFGQVNTLKELTLGKFVTDATDLECSTSEGLEFIESMAMNPPVVNEFSAEQYATVKLKIPEESIELYRNAPVWKNFHSLNPSGIDGITVNPSEVISRTYTDMQGREIANPGSGIFILTETLSDGSKRIKKVLK